MKQISGEAVLKQDPVKWFSWDYSSRTKIEELKSWCKGVNCDFDYHFNIDKNNLSLSQNLDDTYKMYVPNNSVFLRTKSGLKFIPKKDFTKYYLVNK